MIVVCSAQHDAEGGRKIDVSINYLESLDGFAALPAMEHLNASMNHINLFTGMQV